LRVALGGSAGVGKTTLGEVLAGRLGVGFIAEGMRARLEAGLDLHGLSRDAHRALVVELFDEVMDAVRRRSADGYVSDRSPMDFLAFWLYYGFAADTAETERFAARCAAALAEFDAVIILPWGAIPLADDGVRTPNPWRQLHYQALLEGLVRRRVADGKARFLPDALTGHVARLDWVCDAIGAPSAT
jgi:hypothetical protein